MKNRNTKCVVSHVMRSWALTITNVFENNVGKRLFTLGSNPHRSIPSTATDVVSVLNWRF